MGEVEREAEGTVGGMGGGAEEEAKAGAVRVEAMGEGGTAAVVWRATTEGA
jgi:hypothetical protein